MELLTAFVVAVLAAVLGFRSGRRPWHIAAGAGLALVAMFLLTAADRGAITALIAGIGGLGVGLVLSRLDGRGRRDDDRDPGSASDPPPSSRRAAVLVGIGAVAAVGLGSWIGANDPSVGWFGRIHSHGPRGGAGEVALTFDDGPDVNWTLEVADILDRHGTKGAFFQVGKAVDAQPEVSRRLHERGHLLANHSYHHDYWRWLDPRYPELDRAEDAFRRQLGVCPALFRPPHGQRTPLMLRHAADRGFATVTWDVSARDWSDGDGQRVARRVLEQVKPGSVILLHDGLDGETRADRSVLRTALPIILDGLEERGLTPVRLDDLLDVPGYKACSGS